MIITLTIIIIIRKHPPYLMHLTLKHHRRYHRCYHRCYRRCHHHHNHYHHHQDTSSLLDWVAELDYLMHSTLKQLPDAVAAARSASPSLMVTVMITVTINIIIRCYLAHCWVLPTFGQQWYT